MERRDNTAPGEVAAVDIDALLKGEDDSDIYKMLGIETKSDILPHEADRDFAPDSRSTEHSLYAAYLGRPTATDPEPAPAVADPAKASLVATDPELAAIAKAMGMTPEELAGASAPAPATPEPAPAPASPEVAALMATVEQLKAEVEQLRTPAQPDVAAQALAAQQASIEEARATYEAQARTRHEERFEHLDDDDREAVVAASVRADMADWDKQAGEALAQTRVQLTQAQEAQAQREAAYQSAVTELTTANPTLAGEVAQGYRFADFLTDTHRAVTDAYGDAGPFEPYAKAVEGYIKGVQTKAFQAGMAHAQTRSKKGEAAPPVISTKGGTSAPTPPRGGPVKLDLTNLNFFAPDGKTRRS
jgi:hypothetical protein